MKEEGSGIVTYFDGSTPVRPGDRVSVRIFFRRRAGEVIYVPGISQRRGTYEHSGLRWVGISLAGSWAVGTIVLPETGALQKSVRFIERGAESAAAAEALRRLSKQEAEEDAAAAADEAAADETVPPPTRTDWIAAVISIGLKLGAYLFALGLLVAVIVLLKRLF